MLLFLLIFHFWYRDTDRDREDMIRSGRAGFEYRQNKFLQFCKRTRNNLLPCTLLLTFIVRALLNEV